jgi:hypothetical protein
MAADVVAVAEMMIASMTMNVAVAVVMAAAAKTPHTSVRPRE